VPGQSETHWHRPISSACRQVSSCKSGPRSEAALGFNDEDEHGAGDGGGEHGAGAEEVFVNPFFAEQAHHRRREEGNEEVAQEQETDRVASAQAAQNAGHAGPKQQQHGEDGPGLHDDVVGVHRAFEGERFQLAVVAGEQGAPARVHQRLAAIQPEGVGGENDVADGGHRQKFGHAFNQAKDESVAVGDRAGRAGGGRRGGDFLRGGACGNCEQQHCANENNRERLDHAPERTAGPRREQG
jgi:hypothetical protein